MSNLNLKVIDEINQIDIAAMTSEMIQIPSYTGMDRQEEKIAGYIYQFFCDYGIDVWYQEVSPGRPNVIAKLPGTAGGNSLMLSGHIDTVEPYDMNDALSGKINDGLILGRGACDMKGPLAAMMAAIAGIKKSGIRLKGDLFFSALVDEEMEGTGVEMLVRDGPIATSTIMGEPTGMAICLGHKGLEWIRVKILGKKVHSGNMEMGINAIAMAAHFIEYIEKKYKAKLANRTHPILGNATINVGIIGGGDQPSTVPDLCEIALDRRYLPSETRDQVYSELREIEDELIKEYPDFRAYIEPYFGDFELLPHDPFCSDSGIDLVKSVKKARGLVGADEGELSAFPAWSDAGIISNYSSSECIVMGPGDLSLAHSIRESIGVDELKEAALIYGMTATDYCGG